MPLSDRKCSKIDPSLSTRGTAYIGTYVMTSKFITLLPVMKCIQCTMVVSSCVEAENSQHFATQSYRAESLRSTTSRQISSSVNSTGGMFSTTLHTQWHMYKTISSWQVLTGSTQYTKIKKQWCDWCHPWDSRIWVSLLRLWTQGASKTNKKFELILTRCTKAYSSSCSQTVSLSPAIWSQFILGVCDAVEDCKNHEKPLILEVQGLSKSSMLIWLKSSSLVLIVIGSMPMPICNRFDERLANNGNITTFTGIPLFDELVHRFPWT